MIEVIEAKEVPRQRITCTNCESVLEYGNADLHESIENIFDYSYMPANAYGKNKKYTLRCPQCGVEIRADWIYKKKETDNNI